VDLNRIIAELKNERDTLAAAIECLEQLAAGRARKRGRPPAWLSERGEGASPAMLMLPKGTARKGLSPRPHKLPRSTCRSERPRPAATMGCNGKHWPLASA
jgi:hypothetical protein